MSVFTVVTDAGRVALETDDWVLAEHTCVEAARDSRKGLLRVRGTHPTHDWYRPDKASPGNPYRDRRCRNCGGWDNGSYGSHAPCGHDWSHDSLVSALERELAARQETAS